MAIYIDSSGQLVDSDDDPDRLAEAGFMPATDRDIDAHNAQVDFDEKPFLGQAGEVIGAGVDAASRTVIGAMDSLGVDTGYSRDEQGNLVDPPGMLQNIADDAARARADIHPIASGVGQAAALAPLAAAGGGAGVALEAVAGGMAAEAENAWQADRPFSQEAAFLNVGAGLLVGGGLLAGAGAVGRVSRVGRNLLTEAEHTSAARAARDILDEAPAARGPKGEPLSADDIARRGPDDEGVAYIRDNADSLSDELATKQAKAAQELLDTYGEVAPLRMSPQEVDELIPDLPEPQAQWVTSVREAVELELEGLPDEVAAPLRERLQELGEGANPAEWFSRSSELSDELLRARTKASRATPIEDAELDFIPDGAAPAAAPGARLPNAAERLTEAKAMLDEGLQQESLWGAAATKEAQRARGYAERYGEHIDAFEDAFTTRSAAGARTTDPTSFRSLIDAPDSPSAATLRETLDSARATAEVAMKFGRPQEARRILDAVETLERGSRQAEVIRTARGTVSRETPKPGPLDSAVEWVTREGSRAALEEGVETAFKGGGAALGGMIGGAPGMAAGWFAGRALSKRYGDNVVGAVANAAADAVAGRQAARGATFRGVASLSKQARSGLKRGVGQLLTRASPATQAFERGIRVSAPRAAAVTAQNFDATRDHIEKMATQPEYFGQVMSQSFGSMPEAAPEVYRDLSIQTAKAVSYLNAVAPGGKGGGPFGQRVSVGEDELWEFNERFRAIADPEYIETELAAGRLSSQAIEAFQQMNPAAYEELRIDVFTQLGRLRQQGITVSIQAREQLDTLLNLDGGGEPGLTWGVAERALAAQQLRQPSGTNINMGESDASAGMSSGALSTLHNGAMAIARTG